MCSCVAVQPSNNCQSEDLSQVRMRTYTHNCVYACVYVLRMLPRCIAYIETYKTTTFARAYEPAAKLWCASRTFCQNLCNLTELAGGQTASKKDYVRVRMCVHICVSMCVCISSEQYRLNVLETSNAVAMTNEVLSTYEYFSRILNTCTPDDFTTYKPLPLSYATFRPKSDDFEHVHRLRQWCVCVRYITGNFQH